MAPTYRKSTSAEVRAIFNAQEYWERVHGGEFTEELEWQGRVRRRGNLRGTVSQTIGYYDQNGKRIARVHQNIDRATGEVIGRPDPLTLLHHGVLYDCSHEHG